jgi:hypothetical protein
MNKKVIIALLAIVPFFIQAQDFGYFGKKNLISIHATGFFRAMPQYFHAEKMYRFDESTNTLRANSFRNFVWHSGVSYRRIINKSHAIGVQAEYYTRQLGDPIHANTKRVNYRADWATQGLALAEINAWSDELQKAVRMSDLDITRTTISVLDFKLIWSRSRSLSVLPLGLTSTWGLGFQQMKTNFSKTIYASGFTYDDLTGEFSSSRETFKVNPAPDGLINNYWGIGWMWDLSLNYALNKSWLLSFGSDIRGTFFATQSSKNSNMNGTFPTNSNGYPDLEGMIHGRNMSREIRKEMVFQNTFRLGLVFAF